MEAFKAWEDMSELEQCRETYSDMYKDAYGFRPRFVDTSAWTEADFESEFRFLAGVIEAAEEERTQYEGGNILKFEAQVKELIKIGAKDRETALRWIMDVSEAGGDWEYLCFMKGLPYGYFK